MNWKKTVSICLTAVTVACVSPAGAGAAGTNSGSSVSENRQELSKDWQELRNLQKQIKIMKQTLKQEHHELVLLSKQKNLKLDTGKYQSFLEEINKYREADKKLFDELRKAEREHDQAKQQKVLSALTAHKKQKLKLLEQAEKWLSGEIERVKKLPA
ncbi:hypothetical protein [Effusibacillus dendaii]|uniref:Uncharacterized protein n=1 Tax=Effusibacillus dendaii TaxID=2743772 RepID=A0A7I8DAU4_9BACL|nr:hypothetical protein [Effusibacillus dendaii]BCJ85946.1 hypothetical protein skT53_09310 [Effusibacillus dendaii]